jgi:hypothetical protein
VRKRRLGIGAAFVVVLLAVLVVVAQPGGGYLGEGVSRVRGVASGAPTVPLTDLNDVEQLSAAFNRAAGHPRLVLFLSPT